MGRLLALAAWFLLVTMVLSPLAIGKPRDSEAALRDCGNRRPALPPEKGCTHFHWSTTAAIPQAALRIVATPSAGANCTLTGQIAGAGKDGDVWGAVRSKFVDYDDWWSQAFFAFQGRTSVWGDAAGRQNISVHRDGHPWGITFQRSFGGIIPGPLLMDLVGKDLEPLKEFGLPTMSVALDCEGTALLRVEGGHELEFFRLGSMQEQEGAGTEEVATVHVVRSAGDRLNVNSAAGSMWGVRSMNPDGRLVVHRPSENTTYDLTGPLETFAFDDGPGTYGVDLECVCDGQIYGWMFGRSPLNRLEDLGVRAPGEFVKAESRTFTGTLTNPTGAGCGALGEGIDRMSFAWQFTASEPDGTATLVNHVRLDLTGGPTSLDNDIFLLDPEGREIARSTGPDATETIDLDRDLAPGMYTVVVETCLALQGSFTVEGTAAYIAA